jgi:Holliday junction resolvasome RuvABC endonuclease subunit
MKPLPDRAIRLVGQDPSLRNWGIAVGTYWLDTQQLFIESVHVTNPVLSSHKQVRQNSLDLESAAQLYRHAAAMAKDAQAVFIEVPIGSQSARAMASYGVCVGVLGALRESGIPFFELTPTEVKLAGPGSKTASKQDMIRWATKTHPEANWPTYLHNGEERISEAKAEHMADAVAAIHAGLACTSFRQILPLLAANQKN